MSALTLDERAEILAVAQTSALEAGEILLGHLGQLDAREIRSKSAARDLVTAADVESERHLVRTLREHFPQHAIVAEEEVHDAGAHNVGARWFLDPLDGTVNFVHRLPFFAVSMGLWVEGVPEVAVVHAPQLGETFTATRGGGAYCNGERLTVSTTRTLGEAILATGFPYRRGELANDNLANFNGLFYDARGLRRMGSAALDLAYVAAGRLDAYWELHLQPHDVAAGGLLVTEAGGRVSDVDGGQDWLRLGHLVAGNSELHGLLLPRVTHTPSRV